MISYSPGSLCSTLGVEGYFKHKLINLQFLMGICAMWGLRSDAIESNSHSVLCPRTVPMLVGQTSTPIGNFHCIVILGIYKLRGSALSSEDLDRDGAGKLPEKVAPEGFKDK